VGKLFVIASFLAVAGGCTKKSDQDKAPPPPTTPSPDPRIAEAKQFVTDMDAQLRKLLVDASVTEWANETDITPEHEKAAADASAVQAKGVKQLVEASRKFDPILDKLDASTRRQLKLLKFISPLPAPDDPKQADELAAVASEMTSIYGKGKACTTKGGKEECKELAALDKVLQTSHKPDELLAAWQGWHDSVGHAEREPFAKYVELANAGARTMGFTDVGQWWKSGYDMTPEQFEAETDRLYNQLKPLYTQLHCYTRAKLNKVYGDKVVGKTGPIPAHLTGNMWAQTWTYLYKELEPFPGQPTIDVTPTLAKPEYDDKKMVKIAEGFYTSLGFPALPATFWERSMFQKPAGKDAVCHASSWDVTYSDDLRIKMCIQKNQEDLDTIHHELGHSFYFAAYYKLPIIFQQGANDGFHEAIGDTVVLSETPAYLKERGLLDKVEANDKVTINRQMAKALDKIAFLPWGLMVDKWRWDVFSGKVKPEDWNKHWWDLRLQYQGIAPPVPRAATDFDPGSKYHVPANVPYMRYFLAAVLQFQFQRALCKKAGFTGPLHECSIYNNPEAGKAFWAMLQKGASQPWQDTLFELTGSREMDASAMLEYFQPLQKWLEEQNKGQTCGW
jgi:peptidyl-dipeptidase A